jgi:uncharacterized repeat protein (TIGR04076 family)
VLATVSREPRRHDDGHEPSGQAVAVRVESIGGSGSCPLGLVVDDTWVLRSGFVPEDMCSSAYAALLPLLQGLRFGASYPWEEPGEAHVSCPDPDNPVVFSMKVLP